MSQRNKKQRGSRNGWDVLNTLIVFSFRRGQALLFLTVGTCGLIFWKTPGEYYPKLWDNLFSVQGGLFWFFVALSVLATYFAIFINAKQRSKSEAEIKRLSEERSAWQERALQKGEIETSE